MGASRPGGGAQAGKQADDGALGGWHWLFWPPPWGRLTSPAYVADHAGHAAPATPSGGARASARPARRTIPAGPCRARQPGLDHRCCNGPPPAAPAATCLPLDVQRAPKGGAPGAKSGSTSRRAPLGVPRQAAAGRRWWDKGGSPTTRARVRVQARKGWRGGRRVDARSGACLPCTLGRGTTQLHATWQACA